MIYQQTPDFYNEYISHSAVWEGRSRYRNGEDELEHGWAKDATAKAHKYIERWRGKNGKWYYRYKSKAQELGTKIRRKLGTPYNSRFSIDPETITTRNSVSGARITFGDDYGRADSHSGKQRLAHLPNDKARERYKAGISAGRKRATKKGYGLSKGKTGTNLTSRGYSGSKGSGESQRQRNLGTRHSSRSYINTTKDTVKIGNITYIIDKAARAKGYNEWRKNPQRMMAKDAILNKRELGKSDKYSANKEYKRGKKKKR